MAHWTWYTSDGEGPTRVDIEGELEGSISSFDLAFLDPFDLEPVAPATFDERMEEVFKTYVNVRGRLKKKGAGLRYYLKLEWPTARLNDRGAVAALVSLGIGSEVIVYPHNDNEDIYFRCVVVENNVMGKEHVAGIRYPSYAPMIAFQGVDLISIIPHNWTDYHYFFIEKAQWAAYTLAEKQRAVTMRSKALWANYATSDYKGFFTAKSYTKQEPA